MAIVGCGMVADQHAGEISRLPGAKLVASCDRERLMAQQFADRFEVDRYYVDVAEMLEQSRPDVVHITTPAQTHFGMAKTCLEWGAHVYVEKPFTISACEAEEVLALAGAKGLLVTVGHNLQFEPNAVEMRELVRAGFLGGPPIHIESLQCFGHADPTYGSALLGDADHWVRSLPGSLLHNLISHGIAKIAEYLPGEDPQVIAHSYSSPLLEAKGQLDLIDELRAVIHDDQGVTASFTFTTQFAANNRVCLYGRDGTLTADSTTRTLIRKKNRGYKSYLRYFLEPLDVAREYRRSSLKNVRRFVRNDFHMGHGMHALMRQFYESILGTASLPIPYREILLISRIMDRIFSQMPVRHSTATTPTQTRSASVPETVEP